MHGFGSQTSLQIHFSISVFVNGHYHAISFFFFSFSSSCNPSASLLVFQQVDIVLFLVFLSFCAARIFMILPSISFSFFYMLAAVISILAFLRSLTYSSISLSSAAIVAHVANALTSTGKIPLFRHSWLKVRWWHNVT